MSTTASKDEKHVDRCVYIAQTAEQFSDEDFADIRRVCYKNNKVNNITGLLLFTGHYFLQVLEGEAEKVKALMAKIKSDPRQTNLRLLTYLESVSPEFSCWHLNAYDTMDKDTSNEIGMLINLIGRSEYCNDRQTECLVNLLNQVLEQDESSFV